MRGSIRNLTENEKKHLQGEDLLTTHDLPIIENQEISKNQDQGFKMKNLPITINPEDLIDKIIYYGDHKGKVEEQITPTQYRISYKNGKKFAVLDYEEIIKQLTHIDPEDDEGRWEFEDVIGHRWNKKKPGRVEVLIKWKNLEDPSWEPLEVIKTDDPITLAKYAETNNLLDKSVWKWAKKYLNLSTSFQERIKRICASKYQQKYKFGEIVPTSIQQAYNIDELNKTTGWKDAINKEIHTLRDEFKCFKIYPKGHKLPKDYIFIKLLWAFDVKHDGRKRARLVAGGHMTPKLDKEDTTSTMITNESIRLLFLIATIQNLKILAADVSHAYINAYSKEKVYTIAGPEFGKR